MTNNATNATLIFLKYIKITTPTCNKSNNINCYFYYTIIKDRKYNISYQKYGVLSNIQSPYKSGKGLAIVEDLVTVLYDLEKKLSLISVIVARKYWL